MKKILYLLFAISITAHAQYTSKLSIPEIMQGEDFVGYLPERVQWSPDGKFIYFSWNPDKEITRSLYKVDVATGKIDKVSTEEQKSRAYIGQYNEDRSRMVYDKNGDIFLYDTKTNKATQVTNTLENENVQGFSGDQKHVIYSIGNNLFSWSISSGVTKQLTDFKSGNKKADKKLPAEEQWLENDQLALFDILVKRKQQKEAGEEERETLKPDRPLEIYVGKKRVSNTGVSPDMNYITYRLTTSAEDKSTEVTYFVTESGYSEQRTARSKVGSPQSSFEMGIYDVKKDTTYIIDTKQIEGIYDKPEFLKDYAEGEFNPKYDEPRGVVIHGPFYAKSGKAFVDIRSDDNKDRWLMQLDLANGNLTLIDRQHDDAWIGGPGISSWNFFPGNLGWLPDGETIWFQSEETGYSHLYTYNINTKKKKALTQGEFEIRDAQLSNDKKYFYIQSNKVSPHVSHFYKLPVSGGTMAQITSKEGNNNVYLSPDEKQLAVLYSYSNKPWELYLMKNKEGAEMKQLTESTTEAFKSYEWKDPEIVQFKAEDGAEVAARLYKPEKANGAAVIFVHGAGYLQNVHKWWSSYYREYMFHNYLTDMGYTVMDIDYRGSDGYGRDWRTGIYRWMGGKDLSDQVDGAKYLVDHHGVDKDRIGIYGGSYGGFITLMAMFTAPDTFQSGAALRSVTDWAHYNHGYTSNILNTPVQDSIAYAKSSPIYFADGLKGKLVMLHGMVDDNVQFQDVVRLSQRLIELGKKDWDLAVFPLERHGFVEASSWADEYRRIYELFEETLKEK
ncbi:S9 family peptidase [Fulvivirga ligni]|uniref:S9 family peptidase n=1 Tax=Fulvivirga ligni TaxID=2904246 RepID=UPI001F46F1A3|nr:prolyl oligopeptidase family serine peptidase [Fulvivirga ligni]UII22540.1 prolyl oligopeptidase family serine peptidase [Fulvivirga ligni]